MDYLKLYDLEGYLFDVIRPAFQRDGRLNAFDFFCIIIWKANRAKSKVAKRLRTCERGGGREDLTAIVGDMTSTIAKATPDDREQMRVLIEDWGFHLPMASAILSVLYPETFTVYDVRVCDELNGHYGVQDKSRFDDLWAGYCAFREDVRGREPNVRDLRDKDRILWARSFAKQLNKDIRTLFIRGYTRNG